MIHNQINITRYNRFNRKEISDLQKDSIPFRSSEEVKDSHKRKYQNRIKIHLYVNIKLLKRFMSAEVSIASNDSSNLNYQ